MVRGGGRNDPNIVCKYELKKKKKRTDHNSQSAASVLCLGGHLAFKTIQLT
jgi:hypothetical protein